MSRLMCSKFKTKKKLKLNSEFLNLKLNLIVNSNTELPSFRAV